MTKIIIEVRGGTVVGVVSNTANVEIQILDFDNCENGQPITGDILAPDCIMTDKECMKYVQEEVQKSNKG